MSRSLSKLIKRCVRASQLGFPFYGTSKTPLPGKVKLGGRRIPLQTPGDGGYLCDIINLWLDDEYGLRSMQRAPRNVVDIGANIGLFSMWAAHLFPDAEIHAYEPNPRVLPSLHSNVSGFSVKVFAAGVGHERGRAVIRDDAESRLAMTSMSSAGLIEIIPLSEVLKRCDNGIDLLKLDCEGAEWSMFDDVVSFEGVSEIRMEYHLVNGHTLAEFNDRVQDLGFSVTRHVPNQGFGIVWLRRTGSLGKVNRQVCAG